LLVNKVCSQGLAYLQTDKQKGQIFPAKRVEICAKSKPEVKTQEYQEDFDFLCLDIDSNLESSLQGQGVITLVMRSHFQRRRQLDVNTPFDDDDYVDEDSSIKEYTYIISFFDKCQNLEKSV
jgi:hypothetical protein